MSASTRIAALGCLLVATGCVSAPLVMAEPVGPAPTPSTPANTGGLIVYTETYYPMRIEYEPAVRRPYVVLDSYGNTIRKVVSDDARVEPISLPAGYYVVRARGLGNKVDVTVRVVAGRTTVVHLDGAGATANVRSDELVYAPDGTVVGWQVEP